MKTNNYLKIISMISCITLLLINMTACGGQAPEASKARSRAVINSGDIVPQEEIREAEYLQYYEQSFAEPVQEAVGLDLRLGNSRMPLDGGLAWMQIGLQTKSAEREVIAPLNLAIVIDRSGSMADADKMPYVKQSLRIFLKGLKPDDIVSLVTYGDTADLLLSAQPIGDGHWIQETIDQLTPDGSTNLHAGLMMGFQQVERHFDSRRNNRVILLTDGMANEGVTDPAQIATDALAYNQQGIYLSTIGLGFDFNDSLLITLAKQGEGGYTFVDNAQEMERVFGEHAASLKQRVADEVSVTVIPEPGVRLIGLTGLDKAPPEDGAAINLWPMGTGDSAVVLAQLHVSPSSNMHGRPLAEVRLTYLDEFAQRLVEQTQTIQVEMVSNLPSYDPTWDLEVLRNVTIQRMASDMRRIDRLFEQEQYETAWRLAVELEQQLTEVARLTNDHQMLDDAALMRRYQQTLADAVWEVEERAPRLDNSTTVERPYRGRADMPTADIE